MPALVAGIHVLAMEKDVDGPDEPGHDDERSRLKFANKKGPARECRPEEALGD
jgi:hypothetical protein